jgi:hypothetical protein
VPKHQNNFIKQEKQMMEKFTLLAKLKAKPRKKNEMAKP